MAIVASVSATTFWEIIPVWDVRSDVNQRFRPFCHDFWIINVRAKARQRSIVRESMEDRYCSMEPRIILVLGYVVLCVILYSGGFFGNIVGHL